VQKNSIVKISPELQGTSILCRYYKAPATNTREFLALLVAGSCYDKMLSSVLRGKYGICYSSGNVTTSRLINYGQDIIYSCSDFNDIKQKIIEVQQILLSGKYICSLDGDKEFVFEELSEVLEGFKNSQLIRFYTANRSSVEILDHVYISLMYFNNPVQIYSFYEQINYLTQEEILNAFKKYIITDDELWVGITSSELEDKLSAELSK
jgi:predicted Zn-dependent peptidase